MSDQTIDETRSVLAGLSSRSAFAPSLPASSGGFSSGVLVTAFSALVLILGLATTAPDGATAHELSVILRDGPTAGSSGAAWGALAAAFESLPFGPTSVWRISLANALATALAAGLLAVWLRQRDVGRRAAVAAGMLFAFSLPVWQSAVVPGPIPLIALLSLVSLVLLEESIATRRRLPRLIGWGVIGLTLTQGPLAIGSIVAVVAACSLPRGAWSRPHFSSLIASAVGFGGGFLLLGGSAALSALFAQHSGGWDPAHPAEALLETAWLSGPTGCVALLGLLILWWRHPGDAGALTLLCVIPLASALLLGPAGRGSAGAVAFASAVPISFAALAALAGAALDTILQRYAATPSPRAHTLTAVAAALPIGVLALGAPLTDRSEYLYGEEWARSVLNSLPDDAVLFTAPDPRGGLLDWLQLIGAVRPDVVIADPAGTIDPRRSPLLEITPPPKSPSTAIAAMRAKTDRPIFSVDPIPTEEGRWTPWALVWRWGPKEGASAEESAEAWAAIQFTHLPATPDLARAWLGGETAAPVRDATASTIAADYFQAIARRDGKLSQIGPWATILERLGELRGVDYRPRGDDPDRPTETTPNNGRSAAD